MERARSTPSGAWSKRAWYRLREGCRWRALPHDFPPDDTVFDRWQRWQERGVWHQAVAVPGTRWREQELGRARRHASLESQSIKSAEAWLWCAMMRLLVRRVAV